MSAPDYTDLPAPMSVPIVVPGSDLGMRYATHDVLINREWQDDPTHGYDDEYLVVRCPACGDTFSEHGRYFKRHAWEGYEMHVSSRHRGTKYAIITVVGQPIGLRPPARQERAGRHFDHYVDGRISLLDFTIDEEERTYSATFQMGKWRGDIANDKLARQIREAIDFEEFVSVDIEWHHDTPRTLLSGDEAAEVATHE